MHCSASCNVQTVWLKTDNKWVLMDMQQLLRHRYIRYQHTCSHWGINSSMKWESQRFIFRLFIFIYFFLLPRICIIPDVALLHSPRTEMQKQMSFAAKRPSFSILSDRTAPPHGPKQNCRILGDRYSRWKFFDWKEISTQEMFFLLLLFLSVFSNRLWIVINREKVTTTVKPQATEKIQIFFDLMEILCVCVFPGDKVDCSLWMWDEFSNADELKVPNTHLSMQGT